MSVWVDCFCLGFLWVVVAICMLCWLLLVGDDLLGLVCWGFGLLCLCVGLVCLGFWCWANCVVACLWVTAVRLLAV